MNHNLMRLMRLNLTNLINYQSMKKIQSLLAVSLLTLMAILMFGSVWNDSAIMDELPHIPAGYSYLAKGDYRLNPEHPPLIKMIAAIPLLFLKINFPDASVHWTNDINGQWDFGREFLYRAGNDADLIIFWSRVPIILLTLFAGWFLFAYIRKRFSDSVALLTLGMYALSPTIIAHSRLVTTDLGALVGFLLGIFGFVEFLKNPNRKNIIIAGLCFGTATVLKFSLILLLPMYAIMFIAFIVAQEIRDFAFFMRVLGKCLGIACVAIALIWPIYQYTIWNYPPERQRSDTEFTLESFANGKRSLKEACATITYLARCPAELTIMASDTPLLRPLAQYMLGLLMVFQRSAGGNTAYFMGEVSNTGSRLYFPIAYSTKEATPILIMLALAFFLAIQRVLNAPSYSFSAIRIWIKNHFIEFSSLIMIAVYWAFSIKSPLNIGIRHIMPTLPFMYLLIAVQITRWFSENTFQEHTSLFRWTQELVKKKFLKYAKIAFIVFLFLLLIFKMLIVYPSYLSYYNIFGGGTDNGYLLITDSNYDWGQDLKRLRAFTKKNNINTIAVDYFGGGDLQYYFGDQAKPWWSARGPAKGWFAISATFLQGARGKTVSGFERKQEDEYSWLRKYEPVARAGKSIFIYKLPD